MMSPASDLEFGEEAVSRFDGEAVDEGLRDGLEDAAGAVKGDVTELVSYGRDFGCCGQWGFDLGGGAERVG